MTTMANLASPNDTSDTKKMFLDYMWLQILRNQKMSNRL